MFESLFYVCIVAERESLRKGYEWWVTEGLLSEIKGDQYHCSLFVEVVMVNGCCVQDLNVPSWFHGRNGC